MTFKEKIRALFANKETKPLPHQSLEMGQIDQELSSKILQETGLDLTGYFITIDNYGMLHALNRHGHEPDQNQVSLTKEDFEKLEQIIQEVDTIEEVSRHQQKALQFTKLIENEYFTIFEIVTVTGEKKKLYKKNRIHFKTMFIRKGKKD